MNKKYYPTAIASAVATLATMMAIPVQAQTFSLTELGNIIPYSSQSYQIPGKGSTMLNGAGNIFVSNYYDSTANLTSPLIYQNGISTLLSGNTSSVALALSQDGSTIVGASSIGNNSSQVHAAYWKNGILTSLVDASDTASSVAYGASQNGTVIVGVRADTSSNGTNAVVWKNGVMTTLNSDNKPAMALAVSGDGSVIAGIAFGTTGYSPVSWTNGVMTTLPSLSDGIGAFVSAISNNGKVIVGTEYTLGSTSAAMKAVSWSNNTITDLTASSNLDLISSNASGVNANGMAIVGTMMSITAGQDGFRWTNKTGMQSIEDWLKDSGVNVVSHTVATADAINAAGDIVSGTLINGHAYIARGYSGLIDEQSFNQGLAKVANSGQQANSNAALVMNGMHSNPMRTLLADGHSSFSVGGDIGRQNSTPYDSDMGLGEITYGHRFNNTLQLNLSAGQTYSRTDTDFGGKTTSRSTYIMPEFVFTLPHNVYATVNAYYGQGKTHINRGYDNAGTIEMTNASPDTTSIGARLRLDWLNLFSLGKTEFTPYSSLSYVKTRMNSYTEENTSFPTLWDARNDRATIFTVGMDAIHPINDRFSLQGRLEASHQFENRSAYTSGQVVGLYSFAFNGQNIDQNWLRAGIGGEAKIGPGKAYLMLNASTQSSMPTYWVSANYQWNF